MSLRRVGALFALVASIALIAFATLTPGVASGADAAHWQFTAGSMPLTDACSNVLLFVCGPGPIAAACEGLAQAEGWNFHTETFAL